MPVTEQLRSAVRRVPPLGWVVVASVVLAAVVLARQRGGSSTTTLKAAPSGGGGGGTSLTPDAGATLAGLQAQVAALAAGTGTAATALPGVPGGAPQPSAGPAVGQVVVPTALTTSASGFDASFVQGVLDTLNLAPQHYPADAGTPSTGVPIWEGLKVGTIDPGGRLVLGENDVVNPAVVYNAAQEPIGYNPEAQYTLSQARAWWDNWLANPYDISAEHNIPVSLSLTAEQKARVRSYNMVGVPSTPSAPGTSWSP
jgi:hypothetical protein